jgi:hypothetical protein
MKHSLLMTLGLKPISHQQQMPLCLLRFGAVAEAEDAKRLVIPALAEVEDATRVSGIN